MTREPTKPWWSASFEADLAALTENCRVYSGAEDNSGLSCIAESYEETAKTAARGGIVKPYAKSEIENGPQK